MAHTRRRRQAAATLTAAVTAAVMALSIVGPAPSVFAADQVADWGRVPFSYGLRDRYGDSDITAVAAGTDGRLVAVGHAATGAAAWSSDDGLVWQRAETPPDWVALTWTDVAATPAGFVAVGYRTLIRESGPAWEAVAWASPDGLSWQPTGAPSFPELSAIAGRGERLVVIAQDQDRMRTQLWSSDDAGLTWAKRASFRRSSNGVIAAGPSGWLAAVETSRKGELCCRTAVYLSADGLTWEGTALDPEPGTLIRGITAFGHGWVAVGFAERDGAAAAAAWLSPDGHDWVRGPDTPSFRAPDRDVLLTSVTATPDGGLVAVGSGATGQLGIWRSPDGLAWIPSTYEAAPPDMAGTYEPSDAASAAGRTVVVGSFPDRGYSQVGGRRWSAAVWTSPAPADADAEEGPAACPDRQLGQPVELLDVLELRGSERLACFGDVPVSFDAFLAGAASLGDGGCMDCQAPEPAWLADPLGAASALPVGPPLSRMPMFLPLHFEPGWPTGDLPDLEWARVTGRFDHPAAEECTGDGLGPTPAQTCRSHFVVTAISRIPAP